MAGNSGERCRLKLLVLSLHWHSLGTLSVPLVVKFYVRLVSFTHIGWFFYFLFFRSWNFTENFVGGCRVYLQQALFLYGLQYTNVVFSSLVMNCIPVWTFLIAAVFG